MSKIKDLIDKLYQEHDLRDEDFLYILDNIDEESMDYLFYLAAKTRDRHYGRKVCLRGLIEFTNYCKRECSYCGINAYNTKAKRYRLTKEEILATCLHGKELGFNTFVLQGGEDMYYDDEKMADIIRSIKDLAPDSAITISIGERSKDSYRLLREAGADRYLLRHETANEETYKKLHSKSYFKDRHQCLKDLKDLGFQVGSGFMVGLPDYTNSDYVKDLRFLKELEPAMVGMGPFIAHEDTPMRGNSSGTIEKTTTLLAIIRLLMPRVLLPATTALASIGGSGRKRGLDAGANVIMPNLTPMVHRGDYSLYKNKKSTGSESAEALNLIKEELESYGYECDMARGDSKVIYR